MIAPTMKIAGVRSRTSNGSSPSPVRTGACWILVMPFPRRSGQKLSPVARDGHWRISCMPSSSWNDNLSSMHGGPSPCFCDMALIITMWAGYASKSSSLSFTFFGYYPHNFDQVYHMVYLVSYVSRLMHINLSWYWSLLLVRSTRIWRFNQVITIWLYVHDIRKQEADSRYVCRWPLSKV